MEAAAAKLLDSSQPFDVALLDEIVNATFDPRNPQQQAANQVLMGLKENDQMWLRVDGILEQSSNPNTRFFALQILTDTINTRWKILPAEQREGIKNYIVGKLIGITSDEQQVAGEKVFIGKMNQVLVQILKQEWPHNWPSFISDLVGASKSSEVLCENNMQILKLLSEEIFDFSKDSMTTAKIKTMKESLNEEFAKVYQLCEFILEASQRPSLLKVTLTTLQRFLSWIPLGYIFETSLIPTLIDKFFTVPMFRNETLECLTEIGSLTDTKQYTSVVTSMYLSFLQQLSTALPPNTNLAPAFENGNEEDCVFIQRLALFFTTFFKAHLLLLETQEHQQALLQGMYYLVCISEVPDDEIFKICLDYYHAFTQDLYQSEARFTVSSPLNLGGAFGSSASNGASRKYLYSAVLSRVRLVLISRMAKPEEVLIVEDENGEIVRELTKDTEVIAQYKTMREALVYLTHLNYEDTENIMLEKLALQVDGSEWSWNNLNTLCWAIGSISGAMNEEEEKRFLVTVIKDLLGLCEMKRGKDNKAVVASNIMYVVGQYPRFLRAHWKFLKTVVNKLFEFMHEKHPGVQDMACDTFLKIANKCKRKFVTLQLTESVPFVEELLRNLSTVISDLEPHQIHTFYEAVGLMLSDRGPAVSVDRPALLAKLMELPNGAWKSVMQMANADANVMFQPDTAKEIANILKTNTKVCSSVGPLFVTQLSGFFLEMLEIYKNYGEMISRAVAEKGELAVRYNEVRRMRGAKREVLKLLTTFIEKAAEPEAPPAAVAQDIIPPLLDPVLADYQQSIPGARDPQVLSMFSVAVEKLKGLMAPSIPRIMASVFECTLQMITQNMLDFPETRTNFFIFLKAVNAHNFQALFSIPPEHQKLVVDSVIWAFKHTERNIADTGLEILLELLQNVGKTADVAQGFYQSFLLVLIQDVLAVMTDRLHKSGFKMHASLLRHMFHLVEMGQVSAPLFDPAQHPGKTNQDFLREHVANLLITSFPNLTRSQVLQFVVGLFNLNMDLPTFKTHLRDFLIQLKEFSAEDNAELFSEEEIKKKLQTEADQRAQKLAVPGLVNPHEIDDMADL